jgi:hypothetical protein
MMTDNEIAEDSVEFQKIAIEVLSRSELAKHMLAEHIRGFEAMGWPKDLASEVSQVISAASIHSKATALAEFRARAMMLGNDGSNGNKSLFARALSALGFREASLNAYAQSYILAAIGASLDLWIHYTPPVGEGYVMSSKPSSELN